MWASYSIHMWWPLLLFSVALCSDIMSWSWIAWYGLDGQWCREKPIQNLWDPKFVGATLFMWTFWTLRTLQNRALHPAFSAVLQMNTLVLRTTDQRLILSVLLFWTTTANTGFCSTVQLACFSEDHSRLVESSEGVPEKNLWDCWWEIFYRLDALCVTQPTVSVHSTWAVFNKN